MKYYEFENGKFKLFKKKLWMESPFHHKNRRLKEGDILELRENAYTVNYLVVKFGLFDDMDLRFDWYYKVITIVENNGNSKYKVRKIKELDAWFTNIEDLKYVGHEITNGEILKRRTDLQEYYEDIKRRKQIAEYRKLFKKSRI